MADELSRRGDAVQCRRMRLVFNPRGEFWRGTVSRKCLPGLGAKVKVTRAFAEAGAAVGTAGPTRYVARG